MRKIRERIVRHRGKSIKQRHPNLKATYLSNTPVPNLRIFLHTPRLLAFVEVPASLRDDNEASRGGSATGHRPLGDFPDDEGIRIRGDFRDAQDDDADSGEQQQQGNTQNHISDDNKKSSRTGRRSSMHA
jgi:hypothetical protein